MKKSYLFLLAILLNGCTENVKISMVEHIVPPFFVDNEITFPLNTTTSLTMYYKDQYYEIVKPFDEIITKLHKEADRYNYYEGINNLKVVNDAYSTGEEIIISKDLFDLISLGVDLTKLTNGAFNIAMGALIDVWDPYFDLLTHPDPDNSLIEDALTCIPTSNQIDEIIILNEEKTSIRFNKLDGASGDVILSLGAISKGYIIQKALELFTDLDYPAIINAGTSTLATINNNPMRKTWNIALNMPLLEDDINDPYSCIISLNGSYGISTSGDSQQYFIKENTKTIRHHILDSISGYPNNYHRSITVLDKELNLGILDALSTAMYNLENLDEINDLIDKVNEKYSCNIAVFLLDSYNGENDKFVAYANEEFKTTISNEFSNKIIQNYVF